MFRKLGLMFALALTLCFLVGPFQCTFSFRVEKPEKQCEVT